MQSKIIKAFIYMVYAFVGLWLANDLSREIAFALARSGVKFPTREFINIASALIILLLLNKGKLPKFPKGKNALVLIDNAIDGILPIFLIIAVNVIIAKFSHNILKIQLLPTIDTKALLSGAGFLLLNSLAVQLLFQKIAFEKLNSLYGFWGGIIASAVTLALFQMTQNHYEPLYIFNCFCLGILIAVIYANFGLVGAIFSYGFMNYYELIAKNTLFSITYKSDSIFYSPSGSLMTPTFGILAIIAALLIYKLKKNKVGETENII